MQPTTAIITRLSEAVQNTPTFNGSNRTASRHMTIEALHYATCPNCHMLGLLPDNPQPRNVVTCPNCNAAISLTENNHLTQETLQACVSMLSGDHSFTDTAVGDGERRISCRCGWEVTVESLEAYTWECAHLVSMFRHLSRGLERFENLTPITVDSIRKGDQVRVDGMTDHLEVSDISPQKGIEVKLGVQLAWVQRQFIHEAFRPLS